MATLGRDTIQKFNVKRPVVATTVLARNVQGRNLATGSLAVTTSLNPVPPTPIFTTGHYNIVGDTVTFSGKVYILVQAMGSGTIDVALPVVPNNLNITGTASVSLSISSPPNPPPNESPTGIPAVVSNGISGLQISVGSLSIGIPYIVSFIVQYQI